MGIEHTIFCDNCGDILVSASTVSKARYEGKRDKTVFRAGKKDYCQECNARRLAEADRAITDYLKRLDKR